MQTRLAWHYTKDANGLNRFVNLLESRVINLEVGEPWPGDQRLVWFSMNQYWENTVFITRPDGHRVIGLQSLVREGLALYRIGVEPTGLLTMNQAIRAGYLSVAGLRSLESARHGAKSSEWRVSATPVGIEQWAAIEYYEPGNGWRDCLAKVAAAAAGK